MSELPRRFRSPGRIASRPVLMTAMAAAMLPLLSGCGTVVLQPAGDIAQQQGNLVVVSTLLMLLIIVPVMALTVLFAWRYRASNRAAAYEPDWDHSTKLELVIWAAPLLIIICLGALTWVATHLLDPYRPLARTAPGKEVAGHVQPLDVQVVALDWKWVFIYPEQGIATVNELALPVDRPVRFSISSSSVMNSFYIPALAGQIYAMPGMETTLHAVLNRPGTYEGFSANYSGAGFSKMRFAVKGLEPAAFAQWTARARSGNAKLDRATYLALERPSEGEPARFYAGVEAGLFDAIVNMCVEPGKMCMRDMMAHDARGGLGLAGIYNVRRLEYDKNAGRGSAALPAGDAAPRTMVAALCEPLPGDEDKPIMERRIDMSPLTGAGLARPGAARPAPGAIAASKGPTSHAPTSHIAVTDDAPLPFGAADTSRDHH